MVVWLVVEKGEAVAVKVAATAAAATDRAVACASLMFCWRRLLLDAPSNRAPPPSPRNHRRLVESQPTATQRPRAYTAYMYRNSRLPSNLPLW